MFKKITVITTLLFAATGAMAAEYVDPAAGFVSTPSRAEVKAEVLKTSATKADMRTSGMSNAGMGTVRSGNDQTAMKPLHQRFVD